MQCRAARQSTHLGAEARFAGYANGAGEALPAMRVLSVRGGVRGERNASARSTALGGSYAQLRGVHAGA